MVFREDLGVTLATTAANGLFVVDDEHLGAVLDEPVPRTEPSPFVARNYMDRIVRETANEIAIYISHIEGFKSGEIKFSKTGAKDVLRGLDRYNLLYGGFLTKDYYERLKQLYERKTGKDYSPRELPPQIS